jgi:hypothetical protein
MPITERENPLLAGPGIGLVMQQGTRYYFRNSVHNVILNKENWIHFVVERLGKKTIGIRHAGVGPFRLRRRSRGRAQ